MPQPDTRFLTLDLRFAVAVVCDRRFVETPGEASHDQTFHGNVSTSRGSRDRIA